MKKLQIGVLWILFTTQTNLGKFTVALPFSTQALGHNVTIFCQVVVFFTFSQKTLLSRNMLLQALFCTNKENLKMSPR